LEPRNESRRSSWLEEVLIMSYSCKNRDPDVREWICFCPDKGKTAKETIPNLWNSWAQDQIRKLQLKLDSLTEEQALAELAKAEEHANDCFQMWRQTC
jgi:hypothetical protein